MNKFEKTHANWANKANIQQMRPGTATQRSVMGSRMQASRMTAQNMKSTYKAGGHGGSQYGSKMTGLANPVGGPASKPSYMK
tara:strand:- start:102 stop:347 length:246 start_codon:yes stop_codon:yes gene_type:complete